MVGIHIHPDLEERMAELVDTAIVSLDGYIEDETGSFDWAMRDPEAHLRQPPRRGCPHPSLRPSHVRDDGRLAGRRCRRPGRGVASHKASDWSIGFEDWVILVNLDEGSERRSLLIAVGGGIEALNALQSLGKRRTQSETTTCMNSPLSG